MSLGKTVRRHRGKIALVLVLAAGLAWLAYTRSGDWSREDIIAYGKRLPAVWLVIAFLLLPLVGFPISILLVLAGLRFGMVGGMAVAGLGIGFHHLAAYVATHRWLRGWLQAALARAGHRVPAIEKNHRIWFTVLFASVHGPPYTAKLYLLALTDIPFRIYFWAGAPVYILFCILPVGAASAVTNFDPTWIYGLITAFAVLSLAGYWLRRKWQASHADRVGEKAP